MSVDDMAEQIRALEAAMTTAAAEEDFVTAAAVKGELAAVVESASSRIAELEIAKAAAVAAEDFERAAAVKGELLALRARIHDHHQETQRRRSRGQSSSGTAGSASSGVGSRKSDSRSSSSSGDGTGSRSSASKVRNVRECNEEAEVDLHDEDNKTPADSGLGDVVEGGVSSSGTGPTDTTTAVSTTDPSNGSQPADARAKRNPFAHVLKKTTERVKVARLATSSSSSSSVK